MTFASRLRLSTLAINGTWGTDEYPASSWGNGTSYMAASDPSRTAVGGADESGAIIVRVLSWCVTVHFLAHIHSRSMGSLPVGAPDYDSKMALLQEQKAMEQKQRMEEEALQRQEVNMPSDPASVFPKRLYEQQTRQ